MVVDIKGIQERSQAKKKAETDYTIFEELVEMEREVRKLGLKKAKTSFRPNSEFR